MNPSTIEPVPITPLPCEEIVLRSLLKKNWFDEETKRIKADAFIRDPRKDVDGLSVNIHSTTDVPLWLAEFNRSFGADTLHSGRIRMLPGLDVAQTDEDVADQLNHAVITGVPFADDEPKLAESLASRLAAMSRTLDRTKRQR